MGRIALAFYIAHRRTSLLGFRLLFAFAVGQLSIGILGFFSHAWIYSSFGLQGVTRAASIRGVLDYALYAVCLAGVISLLRNCRRLQA